MLGIEARQLKGLEVSQVITISDIAAEKAKEVLEAEGKSGWGLRIFIAGGSCCGPAYGMDIDEQPREGDNILEKNGLKVFTDPDATNKLSGMEVDYIKDGDQEGFVIKNTNPDQPPSCNCSSGSCG
jgi:iron-sulfur cluster assembly accessory protein